MPWISETAKKISWDRIEELVDATLAEARARICAAPKRVLLLPPDITRMHSGSGRITEMLYHRLADEAEVHLIPTLGQHVPHTPHENRQMFGSVPEERIHVHDWRDGCVKIGEVSADVVRETSGGVADWAMPLWLNRMLIEESWDLIINVGHVVPHEVLGFANHNKNYFIGLAGRELLNTSHMMAATCGIENNLGCLITPVRECFNRAEEQYLSHLPDLYVQLVLARDDEGELVHTGVHVGDDLETYLAAARQSRDENITIFDEPLERVVCVMQGDEFFSTWVANKAIYRTRMAMADGGQLTIIAPGLKRFGEQDEIDDLIRKYGYIERERILELYKTNEDMQRAANGTAHLMNGTTDGRFQVTYAPGHLGREEIEGIHFQYADINETLARYQIEGRREGWNETADGERFFYIPTPSAGLWATQAKLDQRVDFAAEA
ncbi:MAG: DUF2088 domain-containing protein [Planctomycetota bacterium]|nr:MAG: DUF2088 domain-containing protein [Planctomycetota bacterium]REJ96736.1 MAG: DUF2088 domain-containing protein [Planctomycetota bacterium]REK22337.1 MAG: DUF2088 domain-containing protein [Planctomycetota bacterium]REK39978.1 MAG: DUF2088 domain-containing protein [Planctomycetota bacterium]